MHPFHPQLTSLQQEIDLLRERMSALHGGPDTWDELDHWKKIAVAVVHCLTLNKRQKLAFLLKVHNRMTTMSDPGRKPHCLIIGGPGGTGKSHIYEALRVFYEEMGCPWELNFTAPTGVSSSNVSGSTIHFELGLRRSWAELVKPNSKSLQEISSRLAATKTLVVDEFFFLGCSDWELLSRHVNLARGCHDDPFGNLDLILSGDEFQLTGPGVVPLYNHYLVSAHASSSALQSLNSSVRKNLQAVKNYHTITECVVLTEIVRQKNQRYVEMLGHLRKGVCTVEGEDNDLDYLRQFQLGSSDCVTNDDLTHVHRWLYAPSTAPPLITYTNYVRNDHNWWMAQVFASSTGQDFAVYYAEDSVGRGLKRVILRGQNAQDTWNTPIKSCAKDLSGRLPLVIGMPVYIVDNMAVELGIARGSGGTLISVQYRLKEGKRYAFSAVVDLPLYTSADPSTQFPHRLTIPLVAQSIQYRRTGSKKFDPATRRQLPIIPGFAFTSHNSQSRSLEAAVVHLESCPTAAAAYVMLSRIKCGEEQPELLGILGDVEANMITRHAPEEARREEKRLKKLARSTLKLAKETLSWYTDLTGETFE